MKEMKIEDLLPKAVVDLLEAKEITCHVSIQPCSTNSECYDYVVEMEFFTPESGDQIYTAFLYDREEDEDKETYLLRNLEKFRTEVEDIYEGFDVDEFVELWLGNRDKCPLSASQLVHEGEWIDQFLKELSEKVDEINNELNG